MPQPYAEAMAIRKYVSYTPYDTSSRGKNRDIITFAQFEEGTLLSESCNDAESGNESGDNSNLAALISEAKIYLVSLGDEYDAGPMSTDMLEDICDSSQFHLSINRREAR